MRLAGTTWSTLGSGGLVSSGKSHLAIDATDTALLAYSDKARDDKAVVKSWNGTVWEDFALEPVSSNAASDVSIVVSEAGAVIVAYRDEDSSNAVVKRWTGTEWATLGARVSDGWAAGLALAVDHFDNVYIAYVDELREHRLIVRKWNDTEWIMARNEYVDAIPAARVSLALSESGVPYIGYLTDDGIGKIQRFTENGNTSPGITMTTPGGVEDTAGNEYKINWTDQDPDSDADISMVA
jgi:hypothetical protein